MMHPLSSLSAVPPTLRVVHSTNGILEVVLNRPNKLNSLISEQLSWLKSAFRVWEKDDNVRGYLLRGEGSRAFCAGGDLLEILGSGVGGGKTFFENEYDVDLYLATRVKKPAVALWQGVTMGGGLGISMYCPFRVCGQQTRAAMPETRIGLFPDVSSCHFLKCLPDNLGLMLGLSSRILSGADVYHSRLATHWSEDLSVVQRTIQQISLTDDRLENMRRISAALPGDPPLTPPTPELQSLMALPRLNPSLPSVDALRHFIADLEGAGSTTENRRFGDDLRQRSPLAMATWIELWRSGASMKAESAFRLEFHMHQAFLRENDFKEGVRAFIHEKTNDPKWQYTFEDLQQKKVDAIIQFRGEELVEDS